MINEQELRWSPDEAARIVRETYGAVVPSDTGVAQTLYTAEELALVPQPAAAMALGLGNNPVRYAELRSGETVLDMGAGGGIDTLLAALRVGPSGKAIGLEQEAESPRARPITPICISPLNLPA